MEYYSSDDEPKITKFQVTSVHDGKKLSFVFFLCYFDNILGFWEIRNNDKKG
jgi:hypothetical protein